MSINRIDELQHLDRRSHSLADQSFKNFKSGKRKEDNCECCTPTPSWLKPDDSTMCLLALNFYFITTTVSSHRNNLKAFLWLAQLTIWHVSSGKAQVSAIILMMTDLHLSSLCIVPNYPLASHIKAPNKVDWALILLVKTCFYKSKCLLVFVSC